LSEFDKWASDKEVRLKIVEVQVPRFVREAPGCLSAVGSFSMRFIVDSL